MLLHRDRKQTEEDLLSEEKWKENGPFSPVSGSGYKSKWRKHAPGMEGIKPFSCFAKFFKF